MKTTRFNLLASLLLTIVFVSCSSGQPEGLSNPQATKEAKALYTRVKQLQEKGVMYGHQDDLMYGYTWWYEKDRSDIKEWVGDYPGVVGFELGELETGRARSLDSVAFAQITEQAKVFHKRNGIISVSWHAINPITSQYEGEKTPNGPGSSWDVQTMSADGLNPVKSILPGGENNALFDKWLEKLSDYFLTWKDENGTLIPFLFRPWHEHSGNFFWWGDTRCTDEEFAELWRYTVNYLRNKGLHNILFVYNTDKVYSADQYMRGYPGDEYIDMLSLDWYGGGPEFNKAVNEAFAFITPIAESKKKPFALSECGNITDDLVNIMQNYKVSYFLTWRNAYQPDPERRRMRPGVEEEYKKMYAHPHTLFLRDVQ